MYKKYESREESRLLKFSLVQIFISFVIKLSWSDIPIKEKQDNNLKCSQNTEFSNKEY